MKRFVIATVLAISVSASPVLAEEARHNQDARLVTVSHSDLDLSRADDAASLLSRLRYAATRACEVEGVRSESPALRRAVEQCRTDAVAEAVAQINSPPLTRLHQASR